MSNLNNNNIYDLAIIGAGPAGMTAAIYAQRGNLKTVIFEKNLAGGKMIKTGDIENYPGFKHITGGKLSLNMLNHCKNLKIDFIYKKIIKLDKKDNFFLLKTIDTTYLSKTIIIATGTKERKLSIPGEDEYAGKGVSSCIICEGAFYKNSKFPIAVVGGGYSALETAILATSYVDKVYLIHRRTQFRADINLVEKIQNDKKIILLKDSIVTAIIGDKKKVTSIKIQNNVDITFKILNICIIFINIGAIPLSCLFHSLYKKNYEKKYNNFVNFPSYISVNEKMQTEVAGIYAAGDVTRKSLRQIVTAVNDGAIAAQEVINFLNNK